MDSTAIAAVWCGAGSKLLQEIHEWPLIKVTMKRAGTNRLLLPWGKEMDTIEPEMRRLGVLRRCHKDRRVAMRDLVCAHNHDAGVLVDGEACLIDEEEVDLATALALRGERYESPSVVGYPVGVWMQIRDDAQFARDHSRARFLLRPGELTEPWGSIKERAGIAP